jgi:hypothetical protein
MKVEVRAGQIIVTIKQPGPTLSAPETAPDNGLLLTARRLGHYSRVVSFLPGYFLPPGLTFSNCHLVGCFARSN